MMKIEVWSDYVCPFCYIGKRRLEAALEQFPHRDQVEVVFKSFELDPDCKTDYSVSIHEHLAEKYGISVEQAKEMNENVIRQAKEAGLDYNFDTLSPENTFDAHRLAKFAEARGKGHEMTERLLKAYFIESKRIADHETLIRLAEEVGLSQEQTEKMLAGDEYGDEVRADEKEAAQIGVRGVPFFVINRKYAISGAQPVEVFLNAFQKAWEEEDQPSFIEMSGNEDQGGNCGPDGCKI